MHRGPAAVDRHDFAGLAIPSLQQITDNAQHAIDNRQQQTMETDDKLWMTLLARRSRTSHIV